MKKLLRYFVLALIPCLITVSCKQRKSESAAKSLAEEDSQEQFINCVQSKEKCSTGAENAREDEKFCPPGNPKGQWACFTGEYIAGRCIEPSICTSLCAHKTARVVEDKEYCIGIAPARQYTCYCKN